MITSGRRRVELSSISKKKEKRGKNPLTKKYYHKQ